MRCHIFIVWTMMVTAVANGAVLSIDQTSTAGFISLSARLVELDDLRFKEFPKAPMEEKFEIVYLATRLLGDLGYTGREADILAYDLFGNERNAWMSAAGVLAAHEANKGAMRQFEQNDRVRRLVAAIRATANGRIDPKARAVEAGRK